MKGHDAVGNTAGASKAQETTNMMTKLEQEQQELADEAGGDMGDPRRCSQHPEQVTSSPDGMFDAPCGRCEAEMDYADGREEEASAEQILAARHVENGIALPVAWDMARAEVLQGEQAKQTPEETAAKQEQPPAAWYADFAAQERAYQERTTHQGYTLAKLHDAFDMVADQANWKKPIDATLTADAATILVPILNVAIPFFTGSVPHWTAAPVRFASDKGKMRVKADGYYQAVGA